MQKIKATVSALFNYNLYFNNNNVQKVCSTLYNLCGYYSEVQLTGLELAVIYYFFQFLQSNLSHSVFIFVSFSNQRHNKLWRSTSVGNLMPNMHSTPVTREQTHMATSIPTLSSSFGSHRHDSLPILAPRSSQCLDESFGRWQKFVEINNTWLIFKL